MIKSSSMGEENVSLPVTQHIERYISWLTLNFELLRYLVKKSQNIIPRSIF